MKTLEHLNVNVSNVSDSTGQKHHHSQALIDCKFSATRDWNIICPAIGKVKEVSGRDTVPL